MNEPIDSKRTSSAQIRFSETLADQPWWLLVVVLGALFLIYSFYTDETYRAVFDFLKSGFFVTIRVTLIAYAIAITLGLTAGLGRVSRNPVIYNVATLYVQIMRGLPILVTILYVSFVFIPGIVGQINSLGELMFVQNILGEENFFANLGNRQAGLAVSMEVRGIVALSISYGAFSAEIFRAGIESIGRGQMEAARSLGMNYFQAMRYIILPQAVRRVLPPLGNDFIAMLKESSLISALGVQDITQLGKLYSGSSFEYLKTYNMVAFMYLSMTIILSLGVKAMERRLSTDD